MCSSESSKGVLNGVGFEPPMPTKVTPPSRNLFSCRLQFSARSRSHDVRLSQIPGTASTGFGKASSRTFAFRRAELGDVPGEEGAVDLPGLLHDVGQLVVRLWKSVTASNLIVVNLFPEKKLTYTTDTASGLARACPTARDKIRFSPGSDYRMR